jgi:hypothetical protein
MSGGKRIYCPKCHSKLLPVGVCNVCGWSYAQQIGQQTMLPGRGKA